MKPLPRPDRTGTCFESVSDDTFLTWGWQLKHRIASPEELARVFQLTDQEVRGFENTKRLFRFGTTPYYALLADRNDPNCPIRRQIVPWPEEAELFDTAMPDPLGEEPREQAPNLIHRYSDRALLLSTDRCPVYCRFCTRRRIVGRTETQATRDVLEEAFSYLGQHPEIKEVIGSGGDALMLGDNQLEYMMKRLRAIEHIEIIRIATRMPATCPMRVTDDLVDMLRRFGPIYVLTHFNHVKECTSLAQEAIAKMVDAGLVVYNQSVLLRGINDDADTLSELNRALVYMRVTPYYLHQCDMAEGIEHFRTPLATGVDIIDKLRGHTSGLMVPQFCVDVPGGLGKVTVVPEWVVKKNGRATTFRTYTGDHGTYVDPIDR